MVSQLAELGRFGPDNTARISGVQVNRGIPVAVFSSVEDARNWLRHRSEAADEQNFFVDGDGSNAD